MAPLSSHLAGAVIAALSVAALAVVSLLPPAEGQVAAVFLPGTDFAEAAGAVGAAGGAVVRAGSVANIVVADPGAAPGFRQRLARERFVIFVHPAVAGACLTDGAPAGTAFSSGEQDL